VTVYAYGEQLSPEEIKYKNELALSLYPNATLLSDSTSNYNCHSYAWYSDSTSNIYWMSNPSAYMTDGSYTQYTGAPVAAAPGYRMYYNYGDHSAIIYVAGPVPSYSDITVISKWGPGPLMMHKASDSPYSSRILTIWQ